MLAWLSSRHGWRTSGYAKQIYQLLRKKLIWSITYLPPSSREHEVSELIKLHFWPRFADRSRRFMEGGRSSKTYKGSPQRRTCLFTCLGSLCNSAYKRLLQWWSQWLSRHVIEPYVAYYLLVLGVWYGPTTSSKSLTPASTSFRLLRSPLFTLYSLIFDFRCLATVSPLSKMECSYQFSPLLQGPRSEVGRSMHCQWNIYLF